MKKLGFLLLFLISSFSHAAITLGKDYVQLAQPQPVADPKKVEVIEFFSYTCIHCYHLEPLISAWQKKLPPGVTFRREQIVWGQPFEPFARLFATMNDTGTINRLHQPVFDAVQQKKINLGDPGVLEGWLKQQGVDVSKFMLTYKSFGVNAQVARATKLTKDYAVEGTPSIVVDGKYALQPAEPARLMQVLNELVAQQRKAKHL
jgi:thiol:disulfide interchange protein DsbA